MRLVEAGSKNKYRYFICSNRKSGKRLSSFFRAGTMKNPFLRRTLPSSKKPSLPIFRPIFASIFGPKTEDTRVLRSSGRRRLLHSSAPKIEHADVLRSLKPTIEYGRVSSNMEGITIILIFGPIFKAENRAEDRNFRKI